MDTPSVPLSFQTSSRGPQFKFRLVKLCENLFKKKKQKIRERSRKNDGFKNKIGKKENAESQQENSDSRSDIYKALIIGIT